ncbi:MAG: ABC-2 family transporter protein [Candidatus Paceibacterota bacterium]|jgi:ABC-2 type transport system permease protein
MKTLRLGSKIIGTLVKDRIYYPNQSFAEIIGIFSRCVVLLLLYWYVYKINDGTINGTTFTPVAWSMFFYFILLVLNLRKVANEIMQDVVSGKVETLFSKPVSYLFYRSFWQIGIGIYSFVLITILGGITLYFLVGLPDIMYQVMFLPTLLGTLVLGSILCLLVYIAVGLLAFWMEDINPVFWLIDKAVMILGGSYLPVALFPELMYKIAIYSPFGALYFITHTVYDSWEIDWLFKMGMQLAWIGIMSLIVFFLFKKARKKVSVNGG